MGNFSLICTVCGTTQSRAYSPFCESCAQMTDIAYDLREARFVDSENPYRRFYDLLPVTDPALLPDDAVYTPTVHATALGRRLNLSGLYLKNETAQPTGTTKFRMAAVSLPYLFESGVRHFCTSSTGNSSTAYAQNIGRIPGLKMSLFTSAEFRNRVNYRPSSQIDHYIVNRASFVEAGDCAADFARKNGYVSEQGFFNPGRREGLKLAFFEAADQIESPIDWYVQAISSGMGVYGTYKGAKELQRLGRIGRLPRLLCVQQQSCAPMVRAWEENSAAIEERHIVPQPRGIASAILRGDPRRAYPYMRAIVEASRGDFTAVAESEIREARQMVKQLEGIDICFAAATAVAGLIRSVQSGRVAAADCVLINLTGSDRPEEMVPDDVRFMEKINGQWRAVTPESGMAPRVGVGGCR